MTNERREIAGQNADLAPQEGGLKRMTVDEAWAAFERMLTVDADAVADAAQLEAFALFPSALVAVTTDFLDTENVEAIPPNFYLTSWHDRIGDEHALSATYEPQVATEILGYNPSPEDAAVFRRRTTPIQIQLSSKHNNKKNYLLLLGLQPSHPGDVLWDTVSISAYTEEGTEQGVEMWPDKPEVFTEPEDYRMTARGLQRAIRILSERGQSQRELATSPRSPQLPPTAQREIEGRSRFQVPLWTNPIRTRVPRFA